MKYTKEFTYNGLIFTIEAVLFGREPKSSQLERLINPNKRIDDITSIIKKEIETTKDNITDFNDIMKSLGYGYREEKIYQNSVFLDEKNGQNYIDRQGINCIVIKDPEGTYTVYYNYEPRKNKAKFIRYFFQKRIIKEEIQKFKNKLSQKQDPHEKMAA